MRSSEDGPLHPRKPRKPSTIASSKAAREQAQAAPRDAQSEGHAQAVAPARALNVRRAASEGYSLDPTAYGSGKYHPMPKNPALAAVMLQLMREYSKRTGGRSLRAQPNILHALVSVNIQPPDSIVQHTLDAETARETRRSGGPVRETQRETRRLTQPAATSFDVHDLARRSAAAGHRGGGGIDFGGIADTVGSGLETGARPALDPVEKALASGMAAVLQRGYHTNPGSNSLLGQAGGPLISDAAAAADAGTKAVDDFHLRKDVGYTPDDLFSVLGIPLELAQVQTAAAAGDPHAKQQLAEYQRNGVHLLAPERRKVAEQLALKRGWSQDQIDKAVDSDLIGMAFHHPGNGAQGLLHNAASDLGALLSLPAGAVEGAGAVAQSVTSGDPTPALSFGQRTFIDPNVSMAKGLLNPSTTLHTFYQHPLFAPTLASGLFRAGDAALAHAPGLRYALPESYKATRRTVTLPSGKTVDIGPAARGPIARSAQLIAEHRIATGAPTLEKTGGRGWRVVGADEKVAQRQAIEGGRAALGEATAQADRLSAPLQRAVRRLNTAEATAVFWAENYGTTPKGVADAFRHYAESSKIDASTRERLTALADTIESTQGAFDKLKSTAKGRAKIDAVRRQGAALNAHAEAALRDLGVDPIDVQDQALAMHPEATKAAVAPIRADAKEQIAALRADETLAKDERAAKIAAVRAQRKADIISRRKGLAQQIVPGDSAFAYTRHTSSTKRRSGKPTSSPWAATNDALFQGHELTRRNTLLRTGRLNMDPRNVVADLKQPILARGIRNSVNEIVDYYNKPIKAGQEYDATKWVAVQKDGAKRTIGAKATEDARLAHMVQQQAELLGAPLTADTVAQLYDVTFTTKHATNPNTGMAVADGNYGLVPVGAWRELKDRQGAQTQLNRGTLQHTMKLWRAVALNTSPATAMRNSVGALMFAMMHGATPKDFYDAAKAMRDGTAPDWLAGRGVVGSEHGKFIDTMMGTTEVKLPGTNIVVRPLKPIAIEMDMLRSWNKVSEDYARQVIAINEAKKTARSDHGAIDRTLIRLGKSNEAYTATMKALMERRDPRWRDLLHETNRWLGDVGNQSKLDASLGQVVAFLPWYRHMVQLTLWTMPVHYPGRTVFIQNLANEGRRYLKANGVWPPFLADSMIVASQVLPSLKPGEQATLMHQLSPSGGWNVLATAPQLLAPDQSGDVALSSALSTVAPPIQLGLTALLGRDPAAAYAGRTPLDENGNKIGGFGSGNTTTTAELMANRLLRMFPLYNAAFPQAGYADNAVAGINRIPRLEKYPSGAPVTDPALLHPRESESWQGMLERLAGMRIKPYVATGPIANRDVNSEWRHQHQSLIDARTRARKEKRAQHAREKLG